MTEVDGQWVPVRELSSSQRRVLGVLLEKGFTTPEYYPLTLKAVVSGCNQKSNRDPVVNYAEDFVEDRLTELREFGLVGELHPDSGRSLRYRHYMRKRYTFSEGQLAILTELLLRGRQSIGDLRARASRMVPIDDLGTLRDELTGLIEQGYARSNGSLDRRGVEVDHDFYRTNETEPMGQLAADDEPVAAPPTSQPRPAASTAAVGAGLGGAGAVRSSAGPSAVSGAVASGELDALRRQISELRDGRQEMQTELETLRQTVSELSDRVDRLCHDLGA